MAEFNVRRLHVPLFVVALLLSLGGAYLLLSDERARLLAQPLIFHLVAVWGIAQMLFLLAALASFRADRHQREAEGQLQQISQLQQSILDSAGPMIMATDLEGKILIFNPAAERMLGYAEAEVRGLLRVEELFSAGELERVGRRIASRPQLPTLQRGAVQVTSESLISRFIQYVSGSPASRVRGIEMQYRRKDGSTFPAMVYLGAVRHASGDVTGLVSVSMDLSSTKRAEQALRESEDRYRDLFDNSQEMIATLSPRGRYLYVNPAWQSHFGINSEGFQSFISFESPFPVIAQADAAALFRRALKGENVEGEILKLQDTEGRPVEVAASLSCRYSEDRPVAVRCIFRDVTQQNLRERRLRMQLQINQMIGESTTAEEAFPKVLAALCASLSCDLANLWVVDESNDLIRFQFGWSTPGHIYDEFQRETRFRVYSRGQGLPGQVWSSGVARWIEELREDRVFERRFAARLEGLQTGWAVPVRAVNQVIAVIEFFSRQRQREDAETMGSVETVCASLGQFMARSAQERRIQELNRQNEFILNSVADGIFGINPESGIDFVNPAAAEMLGAPGDRLAGRPLHALLHNDTCNRACSLQQSLQLHEAASGQDVFYRGDGSNFPVEFALTPMIERGVVVGSVLSFRDISQRYALDRMKDEFISTVSHELRTPLTSIRGALGLLSHGLLSDVNDKAANLLRIALSNSDRLVRLINDILDLERMQSGRAPLALRPCAIHELARQVADSMQPVADAAGVTLHVEAEQLTVEVDPDRINQVLTNLLSNAIKFSPARSTVRVEVRSSPDGLAIGVVDEGRGIPPDKLESIFDRFHQVDASDSRQKGGTGLGLAICRTIVEQHGGRIWAEQNSGPGSAFRILLPDQERHEPLQLPQTAPEESTPTLLVCEPDAEARRALTEPLRLHRYRIIEAESREQALQLAHRFLPLAVLVGVSNHPRNGLETMEALKADKLTANLPIVVLSMMSPAERPLAARSAASWLQKPVEESALLSELARVLSGSSERASVLLVEDDEDLAGVIISTLERAGSLIRYAPSVAGAIALCSAAPPDLIILDLALSDGDGLELVRWLKTHPPMHTLPLVIYSAREVLPPEQQELRLGRTEFLTKAKVQPQEVEALVLTMLLESSLSTADKTNPEAGEKTASTTETTQHG